MTLTRNSLTEAFPSHFIHQSNALIPYTSNPSPRFSQPTPQPVTERLAYDRITTGRDSGLISLPATTSTGPPDRKRPAVGFLRPRCPFSLATFNVRTLMRIGQQASLARTLETLAIDVCCIQETRIQDSSSVLRLTSPTTPHVKFHLRLSGDPAASTSGQAGVGIALSSRAEAALLDWIPVDSRLCAVRLEGACKVSKSRTGKRNLFVICAYAPTDCSPDAIKDIFYHKLHDLLHKASRTDIVILAGDLNARVGQLLPSEAHLGGPFGLDSCRSDNGDRLLALCSEHHLFLVSTNFRRSNQRYATWRPPSSAQHWTQIDHIAISYKWRGCVKNCRSYWSTCMDSDHALVHARLSMCYGGHPKRTNNPRLDADRLAQPAVLTAYQNALAQKLETVMPSNIDEHWSLIQKLSIPLASLVVD